ncbi:MAG: hypothetical protein GX601_19800, partial [Anaerolineales bacterium]|nr:hypothetical protein [Anaerolineales bacterium]
MTEGTAGTINWSKAVKGLLVATALLAAAILGVRASRLWLVLLFAGAGGLALVLRPQLALVGLIVAALLVRIDITTGTEVQLNAVTLLIPATVALWILDRARRRDLRWSASRVHRPLALFVLAGLLSLLLGNVAWDPAIPKSGNFWLVQLAQWAIFAFSALVFWLAANLRDADLWLPRLTWL